MNLSCSGKSKSSKDKTAKPDESESPEDTLRKLELLVAQTQSKYEEAQQKAWLLDFSLDVDGFPKNYKGVFF